MAVKRLLQRISSEQRVAGGRRLTLDFRLGERGDPIPSVLLLPEGGARAPAALLIHGYTSRKEAVSETIGIALLARGIASLAIDLPLHGERHSPLEAQSMNRPLGVVSAWKDGVAECSVALRYMEAHPALERRRIGLVGYSLGSFVGVTVAAAEQSVRAVVLAAGGDLPVNTPFSTLIRTVADPLRAVRQLRGRPLLMVNGKRDRTVMPEQARRMIAAAAEPKEIRWWDCGHRLPAEAVAYTAEWLAGRLRAERVHAALNPDSARP
jgi:uncharacterized protein